MAGAFSGTVTGYVAKDPEAKANGKAVGFSIPVSKGKDQPTTWVRVTAWGKTAEFVSQYVKKGSLVTCSGSIELREYESAKGKGTSLELNAQTVNAFRTEASGQMGPAPTTKATTEEDIPW
jgi:single-strand DNA-binding protein